MSFRWISMIWIASWLVDETTIAIGSVTFGLLGCVSDSVLNRAWAKASV